MKIRLDLFAKPAKSTRVTYASNSDDYDVTKNNTTSSNTGTNHKLTTTPDSIYNTEKGGLYTVDNINNSGEWSDLLSQAGYQGDTSNGFSGLKNWLIGQGIDMSNTSNSTVGNETINALKSLIKTEETPTYSGWSYDPAPTYTDNWQVLKEQLANAALNMNYTDYLNSDAYKALQSNYIYNGQKGMGDTLGQASARTGGLASTYAQTAAQQSYNDYMTQLQDVARSAYEQEFSDAAQKAEMAYGYSNDDYQRYLDELSQYNTDRSFAYQVLADTIAQSNYENEWANTLEQQKIANEQQSYENSQYEDETAYNRALALAELSGDYSGLKNYGWTSSQVSKANNQWVTDNTKSNGTKSNGTKENSTKPALTAAQSTSALEKGEITETTLNAYKYWKGETDLYKSALKQYLSEYINGAKKIMNSSKSKDGSGISYLENLTEKGIISETYAQFIMDVLGI